VVEGSAVDWLTRWKWSHDWKGG